MGNGVRRNYIRIDRDKLDDLIEACGKRTLVGPLLGGSTTMVRDCIEGNPSSTTAAKIRSGWRCAKGVQSLSALDQVEDLILRLGAGQAVGVAISVSGVSAWLYNHEVPREYHKTIFDVWREHGGQPEINFPHPRQPTQASTKTAETNTNNTTNDEPNLLRRIAKLVAAEEESDVRCSVQVLTNKVDLLTRRVNLLLTQLGVTIPKE